MDIVDYNIEFAHIYSDQIFGAEQIASIQKLQTVVADLKKKNNTFSTGILIDEFSPENHILDEKFFLQQVQKYPVPLDFIAHESSLQIPAQKLLEELDQSQIEQKEIFKKKVCILKDPEGDIGLLNNGRPTCALLIAAWSLCRLGIYDPPQDTKRFTNRPFEAANLITLLPNHYERSEKKVARILQASPYSHILKNIKNIFF